MLRRYTKTLLTLMALTITAQSMSIYASSRLQNLAARGFVGTGDNVLIGGLVITGSDPKTIVLRARGPALAEAGVVRALDDPTMTLFSGQTIIDNNDNWQDHPNKDLIPPNLQPSSSKESVIVTTLNPGAYTAIVSGVNNTEGIGLVEVFELDENGNSTLLNIAARGFIGTGDNVLIGGLIISGDESQRLVIRAKGPSLSDAGVSGVLANPQLNLFSGSGLIDSNDSWRNHSNMSKIPNNLQPSNDLEAAIYTELAPGAYTAIVSGVGSTSGVGIVEVFDLGTVVPAAQINDDNIDLTQGDSIQIDVLANDSNIQVSSLSISQSPTQGTAVLLNSMIIYTAASNFIGNDTIQYTVNDLDGIAQTGQVNINVAPTTSIMITTLAVPASNYTQLNNVELNADVLTSANIAFTLPNNTISYSLTLQGDDVNANGQNLFINTLTDPIGTQANPSLREIVFCDTDLCSALVPRKPSIVATQGAWQTNFGTLESALTNIDTSNMTLDLVTRTGVIPDLNATFPATLNIKPYKTALTASNNDITMVLDQFKVIAENNNVKLDIEPVTILTDAKFAEVSSDFNDPITAELVTMGDADKINIFFLDSFTGLNGNGLLGISAGLPGTMGIKGKFNGVLINATATRAGPDDFYARTTAEFAFHEMGHFLGLYHTSEKLFGVYDVIDDTPQCTASEHDTNGNGIADLDECPDALNIMFWNSDFLTPKTPMSSDQQKVIFYSPIAKP